MNKVDIILLKNHLDTIPHCGDYGEFYLKRDCSEVFLVLGDGDDPDLEILEEMVKSLDINLTVEAEYRPNLSEYILLSKGIIYDQWDCEDEPQLLSLDDYVELKSFIRGL